MADFDQVDLQIIKLLEENSRLKWKEIGDIVHLTGQAVAARVQKLEDSGIVVGYTIRVNWEKLGYPISAFVTMFMKSTNHTAFHKFIKENNKIKEAFRISGEGCYFLKVLVSSQTDLVALLDELLKFGNYRVNMLISQIK